MDTATTVLLTAAGTLFAGLASGAFVPRWVVTWMLKGEREAKTAAVEALNLERVRGDIQGKQIDKMLDEQQLSTRALQSIEHEVRESRRREREG